MVFSTVKNQARPGHTITLRNTTTASVSVTGLTFGGASGGDFQVCTGQATSFAIAAGASISVCVQYRPRVDATVSGTQVSAGTLSITTAASDGGSPYVVTLGGVNSRNYEGTNEPDLQRVFSALGYGNSAGVINKPIAGSLGPDSRPVGDEILAPYFTRRDTTKPVTLFPLAHYAGISANNSVQFGWHAKGSTTNTFLYAFLGGTATGGANDGYGENQKLLPATTGTSKSFTPAGSFGIVDGQGSHTDDALNFGTGHPHNFRVYPAKTAAGVVITGAYVLALDGGPVVNNSAKNFDAQDEVFLLLNVNPDTTAQQPTAGEVAKTLASFPGTAGGVANTGFTSVQGAVDSTKIAFSAGRLQITTSSDTNTSHTNALQLGVNAGTGARVQARLVGPFTALNAGAEQQAIFWGPNATNYLKAEVEWNAATASRALTIWMQQGATGSVVRTIPLPGGDANTIDLRIQITPNPSANADPTASVSYALNGATTFTALNTAPIAIPKAWITANTPGGIMTSHQQGGSPFTASFASFAVTRSY
jgi:hypothetical protein